MNDAVHHRRNISFNLFMDTIKESNSKNTVREKLGLPNNGTSLRLINKFIEQNNVDTSHFDLHLKMRKYEVIEKNCPVCDKKFITKKNHPREKFTCSRSCANRFYKTGINNGNYRGNSYTTICFNYHEKKCVVCDEFNIVEVHHYDEDNKNNKPENLIPLCPTHHQYWHSRHRSLIKDTIDNYVNEFKINYNVNNK